ncbi:LytTR family DNA-binding domain-containing protein [Leisingera sp. ANG-Vp]|uniref:LytTR family DNA-binding domain-containing protein n=1 Tax=Leisingera sp. ANG-Vp TaxID=1577896 RepID=UPI00057F428F|nr:LytTR family DNA-binding domain-containing protein [Leisingera sp. ANG-Vp]KIC15199.1 hypothetical protein RA20_18785 [Leisingera sp. ANG-Vp]
MFRPNSSLSGLDDIIRLVTGLENFTWRQLLNYCLWISVGISLMMAQFEPAATAGLPVGSVFANWFVTFFSASLFMAACIGAAVYLGLRQPWPVVVAILLLPFLLAPVSLFVDISQGVDPPLGTSGLGLGERLLQETYELALPSVSLAAAICLLSWQVIRGLRQKAVTTAEPEPEIETSGPMLMKAISGVPHTLGNDLVRVEAQDHYVRVVTAKGSVTLKMSFADCLEALEEFEGAQCHRSHWVSFRHVTSIQRSGSAYICVLDDGAEIPLSRRRQSEFRQFL